MNRRGRRRSKRLVVRWSGRVVCWTGCTPKTAKTPSTSTRPSKAPSHPAIVARCASRWPRCRSCCSSSRGRELARKRAASLLSGMRGALPRHVDLLTLRSRSRATHAHRREGLSAAWCRAPGSAARRCPVGPATGGSVTKSARIASRAPARVAEPLARRHAPYRVSRPVAPDRAFSAAVQVRRRELTALLGRVPRWSLVPLKTSPFLTPGPTQEFRLAAQ